VTYSLLWSAIPALNTTSNSAICCITYSLSIGGWKGLLFDHNIRLLLSQFAGFGTLLGDKPLAIARHLISPIFPLQSE
jgi:hypothetical protein